MAQFQITNDDRMRLDVVLQNATGYSRAAIKKAIKEGCILIDGVAATKAGFMVEASSHHMIQWVEKESTCLSPLEIPIDIVFEDEYLLVVNKPAGLLVHPTSAERCVTLVNMLIDRYSLSRIAGPERPGIVHRIDKDTSGLLVIAKNDDVHELLAEDFKNHTITRRYLAIASGLLKDTYFSIDAPIARITNHPMKRAVQSKGREAVTHVEVLCCGENDSFVSCMLEQGRTHQIRVHFAHIGHPLVGDWLYGREKNKYGFKGQALHSWQLIMKHPITQQNLTLYAPLPKPFHQALKRIDMEALGQNQRRQHFAK